ncbi:YbaY family lipoprotein [Halomonas denitrificans]|uniref:YbaY family lipoprotein n=1 Tax=Halomonas denitrificans TaxID=370769 RepID=UPI001C992BF3|nr:YbaY family lipoprotein [Halomonas denitrificans]MBY5967463.1 YbaY family lipoprotein [Halomonas denitrificans]
MKPTLLLIAALTSGLALAGCDDSQSNASSSQSSAETSQEASAEQATQMTLKGTVSFAETGQTLPQGADVKVLLNDVALADAPAKTIAETTLSIDRQAPTDFSLSYDTNDISERHTHSLRGEIRGDDGQLIWTSTQANPVEVGPDADQPPVSIVLHPVGADGNAQSESMQQAQEALLSSGDEPTAAEKQAAEQADAVAEQAAGMQEPSQGAATAGGGNATAPDAAAPTEGSDSAQAQ